MSSRALRDHRFDFPDPTPPGERLDAEAFESLGLLRLPLCMRSMARKLTDAFICSYELTMVNDEPI